jgi:hypothetical protein
MLVRGSKHASFTDGYFVGRALLSYTAEDSQTRLSGLYSRTCNGQELGEECFSVDAILDHSMTELRD